MAKISSAGIEVPKVKTTDPATRGLAQIIHIQDGALKTVNGTIPNDNTIPQNNEGTAIITMVVTPKAVGSLLEIDAQAACVHSATDADFCATLCRADVSDALAGNLWVPRASQNVPVSLKATITTTSLAPITLSLRVGSGQGATVYVNGKSAAGFFGGAMDTYLIVKEWLPA